MTRRSASLNGLPPSVDRQMKELGERVRLARKRRRLTMDEMAERMFVTRKTLSRLEHGDPGVSIGVMASALWVLGLDASLAWVAEPDDDVVGKYHDRRRLPQRVRSRPANERQGLRT